MTKADKRMAFNHKTYYGLIIVESRESVLGFCLFILWT